MPVVMSAIVQQLGVERTILVDHRRFAELGLDSSGTGAHHVALQGVIGDDFAHALSQRVGVIAGRYPGVTAVLGDLAGAAKRGAGQRLAIGPGFENDVAECFGIARGEGHHVGQMKPRRRIVLPAGEVHPVGHTELVRLRFKGFAQRPVAENGQAKTLAGELGRQLAESLDQRGLAFDVDQPAGGESALEGVA